MKRNIWLSATLLIFLASCSIQPKKTIVKREFYTPSNWQQPIKKPTSATAEKQPKFEPVFKREAVKVVKKEPQQFKPKFDSTESTAHTPHVGSAEASSKSLTAAGSMNRMEQMIGYASWYGPGFHGKNTANGEQYNQNSLTAAHKILPMNTWVRVKNLENNKTVVVRINDRGPYKKNRILDLTRRAATELGFMEQGTARVSLKVLKFPKDYNPSQGLEPYKQVVIQLAVFRGEDRARSFIEQLSSKYSQIKFKIDDYKDKAYHVIAGPYNERSEATRVAQTLRSDGIDNFVRSYRK